MRRLCFAIYLLLLAGLPALEFRIESPDKGEVWPKSSMTNRILRWHKKHNCLVAEVTFSAAMYSGGEKDVETYEFRFPGTELDAATGVFYARAPNGERVPIAQYSKQLLGKRIDLYQTALLRVARFKTELTMTLDVNTNPPVRLPAGEGTNDTIQMPLENMLNR